MAESYKYANFPKSVISDRVVAALSALSPHDIDALIKSGRIRILPKSKRIFELSFKNLSWRYLEDYATVCGVPVREFVLGSKMPECTNYSYFDDITIPFLNAMEPTMLSAAADVVRTTFDNPYFDISKDYPPSAKLLFLLLGNHRLPKDVPSEFEPQYLTDINVELEHYRQMRHKERFVFHLNYILDMCTYLKISPHFVFSLTQPLLCQTAEADALFDLFCLLSRQQQITVLSMLKQLCPKAFSSLPDPLQNRLLFILSCGGGCHKC